METDKNTPQWRKLLFNKILEVWYKPFDIMSKISNKQWILLFVICGVIYMIYFILFMANTFKEQI